MNTDQEWSGLNTQQSYSGMEIHSQSVLSIPERNSKGYNVLHQSIIDRDHKAFEKLCKSLPFKQLISLIVGYSTRDHSPLDLAIKTNQPIIVSQILSIDFLHISNELRLQVCSMLTKSVAIALEYKDEQLQSRITTVLKSLQQSYFIACIKRRNSLDFLKLLVDSFCYWDNNWNQKQSELYSILCECGKRGDLKLLKWLIESCKFPAVDASARFTLVDTIIMGDYVNLHNIYSKTQQQFKELIYYEWDGKIENFDILLDTHEVTRPFLAITYRQSYRERLNTLKYVLLECKDFNFETVPCLFNVVSTAQLQILDWLVDANLIDLNAPLSILQKFDATSNICDNCSENHGLVIPVFCNHKVCVNCINVNLKGKKSQRNVFKCPLCHEAHNLLVMKLTKVASGVKIIEYHKSTTLGQLLASIASFTGSILILDWLITKKEVDISFVKYGQKRNNLMHIAAERGDFVICKWLKENGYHFLAFQKNELQQNPIEECMACLNFGSQLIFADFYHSGMMPSGSLSFGKLHGNDLIKDILKCYSIRDYGILQLKTIPFEELKRLLNFSAYLQPKASKFYYTLMEKFAYANRIDIIEYIYFSGDFAWHKYLMDQEFRWYELSEYRFSEEMKTLILKIQVIEGKNKTIISLQGELVNLICSGKSVNDILDISVKIDNVISEMGPGYRFSQPGYQYFSLKLETVLKNRMNIVETMVSNHSYDLFNALLMRQLPFFVPLHLLKCSMLYSRIDFSCLKLLLDYFKRQEVNLDFELFANEKRFPNFIYYFISNMTQSLKNNSPMVEIEAKFDLITRTVTYPELVDLITMENDIFDFFLDITRIWKTEDVKLKVSSMIKDIFICLAQFPKINTEALAIAIFCDRNIIFLESFLWLISKVNINEWDLIQMVDLNNPNDEFEATLLKRRLEISSSISIKESYLSSHTVTFQDLIQEADNLRNLKSFRHAARLYTLAIERQNSEDIGGAEPILSNLLCDRASCILEEATKRRSSELITRAMQDCKSAMSLADDNSTQKHRFSQLLDRIETVQRLILQSKKQLHLKKSKKSKKDSKKSTPVVLQCQDLVGSHLAKNGESDEDTCPICHQEWSIYLELDFCYILPCSHAICATCLVQFYKTQKIPFVDDTEVISLQFVCPTCRQMIPKNCVDNLANAIVHHNQISTFSLLQDMFPVTNGQMINQLFCSLLIEHDFDLIKVEGILFNIVHLSNCQEQVHIKTSEEKQNIYLTARKPVLVLEKRYDEVKQSLAGKWHTSFSERQSLHQELDLISRKLRDARNNACRDVFEQMNAFRTVKNNCETELDLHGLHVKEVDHILREFVLPVLPVLRRVVIITGQGRHSKDGNCPLKDAVMKFFLEHNYKCVSHRGNKGALLISIT
ncbi:hypothetical protein HDV02_005540 [Globomyces sp. JEL0801]|nr:hypothetical protein HDV02_005540 [Globomyces sp. JEL0801]